jgi:hypothetical protein
MIKLAIEIFLVYLVYKIIKEAFSSPETKKKPQEQPSGAAFKDELVQDPHCGVYFPKSTAVRGGGQCFCSRECLEAWGKRQEEAR